MGWRSRIEDLLAEQEQAGATSVSIEQVRAALAAPRGPAPVRPSRFVPPPPPREYPPDDGAAGYVISSDSLIVHRGDCPAVNPRRGHELWNSPWEPPGEPTIERGCKRCLPGGLPPAPDLPSTTQAAPQGVRPGGR